MNLIYKELQTETKCNEECWLSNPKTGRFDTKDRTSRQSQLWWNSMTCSVLTVMLCTQCGGTVVQSAHCVVVVQLKSVLSAGESTDFSFDDWRGHQPIVTSFEILLQPTF